MLAEEARRAHPAQLAALRPHSSAAQAHIGSKATHSKLKQAARKIALAPRILKHVCHSNKWSERTFHMAGWEAHKPAVTSSKLPGRLASKLAHKLLPFGKRAKRYREYYLSQCLPCPAEGGAAPAGPEGQARFFQCRCPRRRGLLKKMLLAARKASKGCDAPPGLAKLLLSCMQARWGSGGLSWSARRGYYGILVPQAGAGAEQAAKGSSGSSHVCAVLEFRQSTPKPPSNTTSSNQSHRIVKRTGDGTRCAPPYTCKLT